MCNCLYCAELYSHTRSHTHTHTHTHTINIWIRINNDLYIYIYIYTHTHTHTHNWYENKQSFKNVAHNSDRMHFCLIVFSFKTHETMCDWKK